VTNRHDVEFILQAIEQSLYETAPYDISPRGIGFRPDAVLSGQIDQLAASGDAATTLLVDRLASTEDPVLAITWLYCLRQIATPAARAGSDSALEFFQQQDRWAGQFPGLREVLLFAGGT
jgi:hypothetical protein